MAAEERTPGVWTMVDTTGREYGTVTILRRGGEVGYKAELGAELVGYFTTLRAALEQTHQAFIRSHAPSSGKAAEYPTWDSHNP